MAILPSRPELVVPLSAIAVGTHYFVFRTIYGDRTFAVLAALVTAAGVAGTFVPSMRGSIATLVAAIEGATGLLLTVRAVRATAA